MRTRAAFARWIGVNETQVSLLTAISDLKLVKLLRDAINAGLPKTGPLGTIPPGANPATPRVHTKLNSDPAAKIEPRRVYHPTPHFEPRPVIHPTPRVVQAPDQYVIGPEQAASLAKSNPIKPPWREIPPVPHECIGIAPKVIVRKVDLIHKGMLLDMFI